MGTLAECRCECGKLMARTTPHGLELKCRGCKRIITVSFDAGGWRIAVGTGAPVEIESTIPRPAATSAQRLHPRSSSTTRTPEGALT